MVEWDVHEVSLTPFPKDPRSTARSSVTPLKKSNVLVDAPSGEAKCRSVITVITVLGSAVPVLRTSILGAGTAA